MTEVPPRVEKEIVSEPLNCVWYPQLLETHAYLLLGFQNAFISYTKILLFAQFGGFQSKTLRAVIFLLHPSSSGLEIVGFLRPCPSGH